MGRLRGESCRRLEGDGGVPLDGGGEADSSGGGFVSKGGGEKQVIGDGGGEGELEPLRDGLNGVSGLPDQLGLERKGGIAQGGEADFEQLLPEAVEPEEQ